MSQEYWARWAQKLQQSPWSGLCQAFLEGAGPLKLVLAQVMLAGSPLLGTSTSHNWQAVAEMLEDDQASHEFVALLRKEKSQ